MKEFNEYMYSSEFARKEYLTEGTASETRNALRNIERLSKEGPIKILNVALTCYSKRENEDDDREIYEYIIFPKREIIDENGNTYTWMHTGNCNGYNFEFSGNSTKKAPTKICVKFKISKTFEAEQSVDYVAKFLRQAIQLKKEFEKIDPKFLPLEIISKRRKSDGNPEYKTINTIEGGLASLQ